MGAPAWRSWVGLFQTYCLRSLFQRYIRIWPWDGQIAMERADIFAYLQSQRLGVLGTLSPLLEPQGALVGYAVTPDLEILFDTLRSTRKYQNMMTNPRVSFTVGNADERTAQCEGVAEELTGDALTRFQPVYFATWPDGVSRQNWRGITWFVIRPRWIRFTDYNLPITQEWSF